MRPVSIWITSSTRQCGRVPAWSVSLKQPEPAILRAAQRGDETAFAWIFHTYQRPILSHVSRMFNGDLIADDVTQEIFIRADISLSRFDRSSLFTSWLFHIAKNRIVDEHRTRARRPLSSLSPMWWIDSSDLEPSIETREVLAAIWLSVGTLDERLKSALLLRDVSGLSYREIAEVLEIDIGNVKWRIFKAREAVQNDLALAGLTPTYRQHDPAAPRRSSAAAN